MLESTEKLLPLIKLNYKRIELLLRAASDRSFKVTSDLLVKLDDVNSVDDLLTKPSTSAASTPQSTQSTVAVEETAPPVLRRVAKRKIDEVAQVVPQTTDKCAKCGCRMLRSVDPGRPDKRRVLECMRTSCLASLKFTELPVGTVVGKEVSTNTSVYNSLARYYPKNRYTPTSPEPEVGSEDDEPPPKVHSSDHKKMYETSLRGIYLHVPGQERMARLL